MKYEKSAITEIQNSMEQNDIRKFYEIVIHVRRKPALPSVKLNNCEVILLPDKTSIAARWREDLETSAIGFLN